MFNEILISKDNLINNIKQAKHNNLGAKVCAMVKANAYGVGLKEVVRSIDDFTDYYGVACFFEAKNLEKLTSKPILIVGVLETKTPNLRFEYTCQCLEDVIFLKQYNLPIKIHIKVNTGMNRFGVKDKLEYLQMLKEIKSSKLNLVGIFTHFATGDKFVSRQMKIFEGFVSVGKMLFPNLIVHADNSYVNKFFNHHLDMARIGFDLYNLNGFGFKSVVELTSTVVNIIELKSGEMVGYNRRFVADRDIKVAVVPLGYADGFSLKNIGIVLLVKNKPCRVLNVCMDCFMLDVSNIDIKKGDKIYIIDKSNPLSVYSKQIAISEYEVMTNFSNARAQRKLVSSAHNNSEKS